MLVQMAPSSAEKISNARIFMVRVFFQRGAIFFGNVSNFNGLKIYPQGPRGPISFGIHLNYKLLCLLLMHMKLSDSCL